MHTFLHLWVIRKVLMRTACPKHRLIAGLVALGHVLHGVHSMAMESGLILVSLNQKDWAWWALSAVLLIVSAHDAIRVARGVYRTLRRRWPMIRSRV